MSRMRVTAVQILSDCPLVVGFGGWGVLGSELPTTGEHGPSVGYEWADLPADNDKEFWVRITTQPASGTLLMWPDSSFEYDGPSTTFEAQLAVDAVDDGTPQTVTITVGAQVVSAEVQSTQHDHRSGVISISSGVVSEFQSSVHSHSSTGPIIDAALYLVPDSASHTNVVSVQSIGYVLSFGISDGIMSHVGSDLGISSGSVIAVSDGGHAVSSETADLGALVQFSEISGTHSVTTGGVQFSYSLSSAIDGNSHSATDTGADISSGVSIAASGTTHPMSAQSVAVESSHQTEVSVGAHSQVQPDFNNSSVHLVVIDGAAHGSNDYVGEIYGGLSVSIHGAAHSETSSIVGMGSNLSTLVDGAIVQTTDNAWAIVSDHHSNINSSAHENNTESVVCSLATGAHTQSAAHSQVAGAGEIGSSHSFNGVGGSHGQVDSLGTVGCDLVCGVDSSASITSDTFAQLFYGAAVEVDNAGMWVASAVLVPDVSLAADINAASHNTNSDAPSLSPATVVADTASSQHNTLADSVAISGGASIGTIGAFSGISADSPPLSATLTLVCQNARFDVVDSFDVPGYNILGSINEAIHQTDFGPIQIFMPPKIGQYIDAAKFLNVVLVDKLVSVSRTELVV